MMSDRDTILEAFKTEIKNIHPGDDNYTSSISEVQRGYTDWAKVVNKPYIGIQMLSDEVDTMYVGSGEIRRLRVFLECTMNSDGMGNYDKVHALLKDVEYWLKYDFSYKDNTFVKTIRIVEDGGVTAPGSHFDMVIEVVYDQAL